MDCFSIYIFDNSNNMTKSKGKGKDIMLGINNFLFEDKGKETLEEHEKHCGCGGFRTEYCFPLEHEQNSIIANTPLWLREHFQKEGREEAIKKKAGKK